jgi:hypothetical protein
MQLGQLFVGSLVLTGKHLCDIDACDIYILYMKKNGYENGVHMRNTCKVNRVGEPGLQKTRRI